MKRLRRDGLPGVAEPADRSVDQVADALGETSPLDVLAALVRSRAVTLDELRALAPRLRAGVVMDAREIERGVRLGRRWLQRASRRERFLAEQALPHSFREASAGAESQLPFDIAELLVERAMRNYVSEARKWWRSIGAAGVPSPEFATGFALAASGAVRPREDEPIPVDR